MQKQEQNIKTMSPDSNEALCIRIQQGDEQAKSQLLQQNEGMIHAVAWRERRRYAYLALELEDLWAAGQLGMLRAARMFRPETGNQFATYAWPHVRQAIQREIISGGTHYPDPCAPARQNAQAVRISGTKRQCEL